MEKGAVELFDDLNILRAQIAATKRELEEAQAALERNRAEIDKRDDIIDILRAQLKLLREGQHGRSSEKIERQIEQYELMLEEIEASRAETDARSGKAALPETADDTAKPVRKPLPDHLPREDKVYDAPCRCPECGSSAFLKAPDKVSEVMEYVPASLKVVRHVEKRLICKDCDASLSGRMPTLPIERGKPGPGLLAHIMVAKFDDHIPLYRQAEIFARDGIDISRSVQADWVGRVAWRLAPIVDLIRDYLASADRIHTDDTPVDVLDPGRGKTKTGRMWVYVHDGSNYQDDAPKAVAYYYSPDRKGEHPTGHLRDFAGVLHADGYAGYKKLYGNRITEAACMAHVRRKFHDVIKLKPSTLADEVLNQISALYAIEDKIKGLPPDDRRTLRQQHAKPVLEALHRWIKEKTKTVPQKQKLAEAMRYALSRWEALSLYLDDGRVEIDNNIAERAIRPIGIGRKNWLFAGSDKGGDRTARILTVIETAKMNDLNPEDYLRDVLTRIADHPPQRANELLPWNWMPLTA